MGKGVCVVSQSIRVVGINWPSKEIRGDAEPLLIPRSRRFYSIRESSFNNAANNVLSIVTRFEADYSNTTTAPKSLMASHSRSPFQENGPSKKTSVITQ
jgi:hypothetical protein